MSFFKNECGVRNGFGYYDTRAAEMVLKRPYLKRSDPVEVVEWLSEDLPLKRFSIGIGATENFLSTNGDTSLYDTARDIIKKALVKNQEDDTNVLNDILSKLQNKNKIRNLAIKCYIFYDEPELFQNLIKTICSFDRLICLDLTGCYFSDEQLVKLAEAVAKAKVACMVWPEPKMNGDTLEKVIKEFGINHAFTVAKNAPDELQKLVASNRLFWINLGNSGKANSSDNFELVKEYGHSIRLGISHIRYNLGNLDRAYDAILADPDRTSDITNYAHSTVKLTFSDFELDDNWGDEEPEDFVNAVKNSMPPALGQPKRGRGRPKKKSLF